MRLVHLLSIGKFFSVVGNDIVANVHIGLKQLNSRPRDVFGAFAVDAGSNREKSSPFNNLNKDATVALANHGINFPIANSGLTINNAWVVIDADPVFDLPGTRLAVAPLLTPPHLDVHPSGCLVLLPSPLQYPTEVGVRFSAVELDELYLELFV